MAKISKEEYEMLKGLDDKWKWIARDSDTILWVHEKEPSKDENYWDELSGDCEIVDSNLFQFIQWDDSEPYPIAELIKEYEFEVFRNKLEDLNKTMRKVAGTMNEEFKKSFKNHFMQTTAQVEESEETEAKSKQELIEKWESAIETAGFYGKGKEERLISYMKDFVSDLNQLDEPETLSEYWIEQKSIDTHVDTLNGEVQVTFRLDDLQNLLVPKQEEITEEQAYNKIAETLPATAKEIESVLEKYYSGVLIESSEELRESVTRAFDAETTSKKIEALTGMTIEQIAEVARNGGIVPKQEEVGQAYKDGYEKGKEHASRKEVEETETVASVFVDFLIASAKLKLALGMEVEELEE